MSADYPTVTISTQPIELCKLLKIANMVSGGGEAKIVISEGYVYVNGEVEFQKRKKIYEQDIIEFNGEIIQVEYVPETHSKVKKAVPKKSKVKKSAQFKEEKVDNVVDTPPSKRRPISF